MMRALYTKRSGKKNTTKYLIFSNLFVTNHKALRKEGLFFLMPLCLHLGDDLPETMAFNSVCQ